MSQKKAREALWLWTLSLSVRGGGGGGGRLQAPQQPCVMQQGHLATSSPFGVSSLNTPNLQAECTSLKLVCSKPEDFL